MTSSSMLTMTCPSSTTLTATTSRARTSLLLQLKLGCHHWSPSRSRSWTCLRYGHGYIGGEGGGGGSLLGTAARPHNVSKNRAVRGISMFLNTRPKPVVKDGVLSFDGTEALKDMPHNIVIKPWYDSSSAAFLGAAFTDESESSSSSTSRLVFKLGVIRETRLLCLFRFKIWWSIPRVGNSASDIPVETQMLLLEAPHDHSASSDGTTAYILFLPLLDGETRSSLQGNSADELQVCVETGDPALLASESTKAVFVNYGGNPFDLMKESMK